MITHKKQVNSKTNLDDLLKLIKRAKDYSRFQDDYPDLKQEVKNLNLSLYSLHTLIRKYSEKTIIDDRYDTNVFIKIDGVNKEDSVSNRTFKSEISNMPYTDSIEHISFRDWFRYVIGRSSLKKN